MSNLGATLKGMRDICLCLINLCTHSEFFTTTLIRQKRLIPIVVNTINGVTLSGSLIFTRTPPAHVGAARELRNTLIQLYDLRGSMLVLLHLMLSVSATVDIIDVPLRLQGLCDKVKLQGNYRDSYI